MGSSILDRTFDRLNEYLPLISIVKSNYEDPWTSSRFSWESKALSYARNGVKRILIIELGNYVELDVNDLLRFHVERRTPLTEVMDRQEKLGITLVDADYILENTVSPAQHLPPLVSCSPCYELSGYSHRADTPAAYRQLVRAALRGSCGIRPYGVEVKPGIWVGGGNRIASSARLLAPCYIGMNATINHGALIANGSSVEQQSRVECGTFINDSTVLPRTHLGPGLNVSQSIVEGARLLHLGRNVEVELNSAGFLGRTRPQFFQNVARVGRVWSKRGKARFRQPTSFWA